MLESFCQGSEVLESKDILKASNGVVYVRRGAQKQSVKTDEALHRLKLDKGIVSFEDETLNIDLVAITNSETVIDFMLTVVPTGEPDEWLRKQNLLRDGSQRRPGYCSLATNPRMLCRSDLQSRFTVSGYFSPPCCKPASLQYAFRYEESGSRHDFGCC